MADGPVPPKGYVLGIDLGTTYSAAAVMRGAAVEPFVLGTIAAQIPTVVVHREDAEILTGEAAERRASAEPTRTAREFKRRLGDPVPIIVGGTPYGAEALMAEMLEAIVRQVTEREGAAPTTIVLTHPANYSEYKRGLLIEAARLAGLDLDRVRLITEPEAAAIAYAHQQRIDTGEIIAVYDFGGGTFDAAVVRATSEGFALIGTPEGMERLGGIDFDQAVLFHVDTVLDGMVSSADSSDPQVLAGQSRLRDECRRAKEALSADTDATISVTLPGIQTEVRLTRDELEQMVRPRIAETVKALQRTIASAGITPADVNRVLLVGGSSRMPIVGQIVREAIGRPVSADTDPKLTIAIGATLSAKPAPHLSTTTQPTTTRATTDPSAAPDTQNPPLRSSRRRPTRRLSTAVAAGAGLALAAVITLVVISRGGDDATTRPPAPVTDSNTVTGSTTPTGSTPLTGSTTVTGSTDAVTATVDPSAQGAPEVLAFDGTDQGTGIPGPARRAGIPGALLALAIAPDGQVYVTTAGTAVLRIGSGQVEAVAGFEDADAPSSGIAIGSDGTVFITNATGVVRVSNGVRTLILDGAAAGLSSTLGPLTLDGGGNLYIADNGTSRIVRRSPDGALTLVAGTGTQAVSGSNPVEGAPAATSPIGRVVGLVVDRDGRLLIADATLHRVRAVARDGTITSVAGGGSGDPVFGSVDGIAIDRGGRIYVADGLSQKIIRFSADGTVDVVLGGVSGSTADGPVALAISPSGDVIFSDGLALWSIAGAATAG